MILTDNETKVDLLNSESIAQTIVSLIRERPDHPVTIGVHGDWGAGKSSVLEMIEASLYTHENVVCIKFNGWRYQGFEDAKIALIENIVTELIEKKSLLTRAKEEVLDILSRIDWLKAAKKAGGLAFSAFTGIPSPEVIASILSELRGMAADPTALATKENLSRVADFSEGLLKPKDPGKNVPKEIAEFRSAFDKLLSAAGVEQLVVLVDDLDRCLPDTAIETLEAIRLFIFTKKTAFVVAADEGMIEYAVKRHFPDLPDTLTHQAYTRNYLEKLIQVPFRIPILGETETKIYVTLLLIGAEIGECAEFDSLIAVAREKLRRPWENLLLDTKTIKESLGTKAKEVSNALLLSDQIGPILASGTKGNPRQIKRFLNTLLLRKLTADARGFGESIALPVLGKLMIAERFIPRLFEQIATASASSTDGKCKEIADLEVYLALDKVEKQQLEGEKKSGEKKTVKEAAPIDNATMAEWTASEGVTSWAKMNPSLSDVDLRPYIYVAKDKKDFFGGSTSLGHLTILIEKLFGSKIAVKTLENEIAQLSKRDASLVFDEIRARVVGSADFENAPDGIAGITSLVRLHPDLQERLVEFLEGLPTAKLGVWVLKGWEDIFSGDQKPRFERLIATWATQGSLFLKTAAATVQKTKKSS